MSAVEGAVLTLHSVFLHFLDLSNALPQITDKACAVLLTRGREHNQDFTLTARDSWR